VKILVNSILEPVEEFKDFFISDIEPDSKGVPILLRHYIRLGGKALAFNIDPNFGNCLDALVIIDLVQVDPAMLDRMMGRSASLNFRLCHTPSLIAATDSVSCN
jgi:hypothetical protein